MYLSRLERECQVQLLAGPAAAQRGIKPIQVDKEEAEYTYARLGTERAGEVFAGVSRVFCSPTRNSTMTLLVLPGALALLPSD
jgi:hypothetical protein